MDRTLEQTERYLNALGADQYILQLVDMTGQKPNLRFEALDAAAVVKRVGFLKAKNFEGYNIYCRPMGYQYVLIDDLTTESVKQAQLLGPAVVMETSHNNFQAWLKLANVPNSRIDALAICRELANSLGADRGSAEPDHVGRLAGFTNRKEKHKTVSGFFPYIKMISAENRVSTFHPRGGVCLKEEPRTPTPSINGMNAPVHRQASNDRSRADFNLACMLIRQGKTDADIRARLEQFSEKAHDKKYDYIGKTIANARKVAMPNAY